MEIETVISYRTRDGQSFPSREGAQWQEVRLDLTDLLGGPPGCVRNPAATVRDQDSLLDWIMNNAQRLCEALSPITHRV